jgi:hypothetical protein
MTSGRALLSAARKCDGCGGPLGVADNGGRCRRCVPGSRGSVLQAPRPQPTCGLGHPGCTISTSDDLAI